MSGLKLVASAIVTALLFLYCVSNHPASAANPAEVRSGPCLCDPRETLQISEECVVVPRDQARAMDSNGSIIVDAAPSENATGSSETETGSGRESEDGSELAETARATNLTGEPSEQSTGESSEQSTGEPSEQTDSDGAGESDVAESESVDEGESAEIELPPYNGPALSEEGLALQRTLDRDLYGQTIEFDLNRAEIRQRSYPLLDRLLADLQRWPELHVQIQGHTDSRGQRSRNLRLSAARANSVAHYLVEHGIARERISTRGYGPDRPLASNATLGGRQRNRRIQFQVVEDQ